jgi:hypothetical protein
MAFETEIFTGEGVVESKREMVAASWLLNSSAPRALRWMESSKSLSLLTQSSAEM